MKLLSIRLRQAQHPLGNKTENELRADRGDARDQRLAQIALDMKFLGVAEAAMGHYGLLAGLKTGFGSEIFRGIGGPDRGACPDLIAGPPTASSAMRPRVPSSSSPADAGSPGSCRSGG